MSDIILKQGTRVLFPQEWKKLRSVMPEYYQIICDANLLSGMRTVELRRFQPQWYRASRRVIKLPEGACLKEKCEYKERTISLSFAGCDAFDRLISEKITRKKRGSAKKEYYAYELIPDRVGFEEALKRYATKAGIGVEGIRPKMFRKTLVSWLTACFPEQYLHIAASMGHDYDTIIKNYLGLGFTAADKETIIAEYLNGWGTSA